MIKIQLTNEAMVDAFFTERNVPTTCSKGLKEFHNIVDVSMEDGIITFILDDGDETTMVKQLLEYKPVMPEFIF